MFRKVKGAKVKSKYLQRVAKNINFTGSTRARDYTQKDLESNIEITLELYNSLKKQAWNNRRVFITELIEEAEGK